MNDQDIDQIFSSMEQKELIRNRRFGMVKPIVQTDLNGRKFVAVGNVLYYSDKWITFIDFLLDYLMFVFGRKWFDGEVKKTANDQHPVMQWRRSLFRFHEKQSMGTDGLYKVVPSGPMKAYLTLSYDLYLLYHQTKLQDLHVRRLKDHNQFQGARYELFATTSMIRAGFDIEFENEQCGSTKHVEFTAVHKKTGERIAVEAKSRHRSGLLGFNGEKVDPKKTKLRVGRLINQAIAKHPEIPYLIFIDLNVHPETIDRIMEDSSLKELVKTINTVKEDESRRDYFNAIFYTNHPYHLGDDFSRHFDDHLSLALSQKPKHALVTPKIIDNIQIAILQHKNIPSEFENG